MIYYTCMQYTKIMVGENCHANMGNALKEAGYQKAFLVCDNGVRKAGMVDKALKSLKEAGIECVEFDKILPEPTLELIDEAGTLCIQSGCDCVVGIGGGSVMDAAKAINILRVNGGHILDYADPRKEMKLTLGLMTVPTTSGTGSELSNVSVLSDSKTHAKIPVLTMKAMSEFAVIDPVFSAGMPKELTIMTGLDVFSHAAEEYTSA